MFREKVVETWTGPGNRDEVIVPLKPEENGVHRVGEKNYFEWWYFDARLEDGHVVVGFLQTSELMTREPGIEIHIYSPTGEKSSVTKRFPESEVSAASDRCDVRVGPNRAYIEDPEAHLPVHHLFISEGGLELDLTYKSEIPGWKPGGGKTIYGRQGYFAWVVPIPRATVKGTVKVDGRTIEARGIGYHDHNWGTVRDMRRVLSLWYWGRLYTDDFTLLYAYVRTRRKFGRAASRPLMLARGDRVILSTGEMTLREHDWTFNEAADRDYPATLEIGVPGELSLRFDVREIIDAGDFLSEFNPALKWLINRLGMRPGWFRFNSFFTLNVTHDGETYERTGRTLHEMVALS